MQNFWKFLESATNVNSLMVVTNENFQGFGDGSVLIHGNEDPRNIV